MGKAARLRAERAEVEARARRDRMARVQVSDEVWSAFRASLGATPVNVALGELVRREVGMRRTASDEQGVRLAVEDARAVAGELQEMIARLDEGV
ncbi:MAG TPA: hypothetical protein VKG38_17650 [Solirubrobacteraceae bacterium]|nr:hypothetical protein [Solirubrobacteraceae bacterium]